MVRTLSKPLACLLAVPLAAAALAACDGSGSSGGQAAAGARHGSLMSIIEDDGSARSNPSGTLAQFKSLGATVVRMNVYWQGLAPSANSRSKPSFDASSPSAYPHSTTSGSAGDRQAAQFWSQLDAIDREAAKDGITLYLTVTGPAPAWAAGPGIPAGDKNPGAWKPSATDFQQFVQAVGRRYDGHYKPPGESGPLPRVHFWSIWNEPNNGVDLAPQGTHKGTVLVSAAEYRSLLEAGWRGLAATGHTPASDTILVGETAPRGGPVPGDYNVSSPLPFIRALYCVDQSFKPLSGAAATAIGCPGSSGQHAFGDANPALFHATGWADHPYPDVQPPTVPTPPPLGTGYADFAALGKLEQTLDRVASARGSSPRLPIYNTEFGYRTVPPGNASYAVPLKSAAKWLNESEYLSWRDPRIRSFDQYLLVDPPPTFNSHFYSGVEFYTGAPKPDVYAAYRLPLWLPSTAGASKHPLQVWGCARPSNAGGGRHVQIQYASSAGGHYRTVRTVTLSGGCYFDTSVKFPGAGVVRLAYKDRGTTDHSRVQQISG